MHPGGLVKIWIIGPYQQSFQFSRSGVKDPGICISNSPQMRWVMHVEDQALRNHCLQRWLHSSVLPSLTTSSTLPSSVLFLLTTPSLSGPSSNVLKWGESKVPSLTLSCPWSNSLRGNLLLSGDFYSLSTNNSELLSRAPQLPALLELPLCIFEHPVPPPGMPFCPTSPDLNYNWPLRHSS